MPPGLKCLKTPLETHGFRKLRLVDGQPPSDLDGRLYRVGPGKFERDGVSFPHWFDGEGLVLAVDFQNGDARAACRIVEDASPADYADRGRFGIPPKGLARRVRSIWRADAYVNAANTALLKWGERLFALYEGAKPMEIDPETLETIGETDFGIVRRAFSAHPKLHRPTGAWINQGFRLIPRPHLDYYALNADGRAQLLGSAPYGGASFTHDFAVTDRYIVSVAPPVFADASRILFGAAPISQAFEWRDEKPTEFVVTPLSNPNESMIIEAPAMLYSHTINAFEDGDDIVLHGVVSEGGANIGWVGAARADADALPVASASRATEIRLNAAKKSVSVTTLAEPCIDLPFVRPSRQGRHYQYAYAAGFRDDAAAYRDLFDAVVKIDFLAPESEGSSNGAAFVKRSLGELTFVTEPVFVPRAAGENRGAAHSALEDDGYLLCVGYDAITDESFVEILSARGNLESLARYALGQAIPVTFHGLWSPRDNSLDEAH